MRKKSRKKLKTSGITFSPISPQARTKVSRAQITRQWDIMQ